jgi:TP901 family phage tail tape measure protein
MSSNPKAEIQITAESRTLGAKLREARAQLGKFGGELRKEVFGKKLVENGFFGEAGAHMVGNLGASAAGAAFSFMADQAKGVFDFNNQLLRFQLAARKTPEEAAAIGQAVRQISSETGLAADTVLGGARAFVDLAGAENYSTEALRAIARAAQASGTAIGDMSTVVYSLQNHLKIRPEEMENVLGGLINQSKDGTIHFQNMAQEIIAVAPKFARFGVVGREGVAELGALFQIAGSGFKDAAEASTGIQGLFRGLQLHEKLFRKAGVATMAMGKDGAKHLRPLADIVNDISQSKLMKDPSLLLKDIGRGEGDAALRLWIEQMPKYLALIEAAKANGVVSADLATYSASAGGKMAIAFEKAKNEIAEAFTPERIDAFTQAAVKAAGALAGIATGVSSVLGFVEKAAQGFAMILGGKSAEDQIAEVRANRMHERERFLERGYDANHPNDDWFTDEDYLERRKQAVDAQLGMEQDLEDKLRAQIRGGTIKRVMLNRMEGPMPAGQARPEFMDLGNYSEAELRNLKRIVHGTTSDEAMIQSLIDTALAKMSDKVTSAIKEGFKGAKTEVKADGKAIVDVHRGSSAHARRPGG